MTYPSIADFREIFTGGLTPGGITAEEFDAALKVHDVELLERAAEVALSVREYVGGSDSNGNVYRYTQRRYAEEGASIAREIRALSPGKETTDE